MGSIKFGSSNVKNIKFGNTQVKEIRFGANLVWSNFSGIASGLTTYTAIKSAIQNGNFQLFTDSTYPFYASTVTRTVKNPDGDTHTLTISAVTNKYRNQTISCGGKTTGDIYQAYFDVNTLQYVSRDLAIYSIIFDDSGYMYVWYVEDLYDANDNVSTDYCIDKYKFSNSSGYTRIASYHSTSY